MIKTGDKVLFKILPSWVATMPSESQRVFKFCLGRAYVVSDIDSNGLLVLDVRKDIDHQFGGIMNDIRVEPEFVEKIGGSKS